MTGILKTIALCVAFGIGLNGILAEAQTQRPPNVLIILADDLGFSDVGCFGGEIETPNLDALAERGMRFTNFYNTGRCWSSRAALLTGYYAQQVGFDNLPGQPKSPRKRPAWGRLLPEYLKQANYRSYFSGKWHLDGPPTAGGFDRAYSLDDHGRYFSPKRHLLDGKALSQPEPDSGYYATMAVADHAISFLKEHGQQFPERPFFGYVAFTAPHFPLHALPEDIAKYQDRYGAGWESLRLERWTRLQELGIVRGELSVVERDIGPPYDFPDHLRILGDNEINRPLEWDDLTAAQQKFQSDKMAIHAAMVDRMDQEIGRILDQIRAIGQTENTMVVFVSDNGASAEIMVRDDGHDPTSVPGSAASHLCLGPGFSSAANTPFRRHKTWVHEGGIHTPAIISWPDGMKENLGGINSTVSHVIDVMPTILALAGVTPDSTGKLERPDFPGIFLVSALRQGDTLARDSLWWCHEGNRAIRVGDWKLVRARDESWELYDLSSDPTENHDQATSIPEKVDELMRLWREAAVEFWPKPIPEGTLSDFSPD